MMNKFATMAVIAASAAAMACNGTETAAENFSVDSVSYEKKAKQMEVKIKADFPKGGTAALDNAICEYISETLGGTYEGNVAAADSVLGYYGKAQADTLASWIKEGYAMEGQTLTYDYAIKKSYEAPAFVTYVTTFSTYEGGAHGMYGTSGVTIRKSDGRRFGNDMFADTNSDGFHALIKEGLRHYFNSNGMTIRTDEQLKDALITDADVNYLPLPATAPYMSKDGVVFIYQPYEIAPYAAGAPTFTVPYTKIKPFLTATAKKLIP